MNELSVLQGESINWQFSYTDQNGTPLDITYYTVYIAAAEEFGTKKLLFKYDTVSNPDVIVKDSGSIGMTNVTILDTTGFTPGKYILEMAYKNTVSGMTSKPDQVRLKIEKGIL